MLREAVVALIIAGPALMANPAPPLVLVHGEAEWIQRNRAYITEEGRHCCSPNDCRQVDSDFAYPFDGGWRIAATGQEFRWGVKGLYNSLDGVTMWACQGAGIVHCLFTPGRGT